MDDMYWIVDNRKAALLIGFHLSVLFDTIDHDILVRRLNSWFGIPGLALRWIEAYLEGRLQYVKVGSENSSLTWCSIGASQESVVGPFLFSNYISPVMGVISSYGVHSASTPTIHNCTLWLNLIKTTPA